MSYLDRIRDCNGHDLGRYRPFRVAGVQVGHVREDRVADLAPFAEALAIGETGIAFSPALASVEARTAAMDGILRILADSNKIGGWRDEPYVVSAGYGAPPLLLMERAGVAFFGVRAYGVHMNGYVRRPDGMWMWIGRRARTKSTYPGLLDNMVAGGLPYGLTPVDNLVKECQEEAAIPPALARQARPVGAITYCAETEEGLRPDVQFCFDLELPADFVPRNTDGELDSFALMPIAEVAAIVRDTREFKFNCNLVVIDFLVRHGLIPPDDPDYVAIVRGLHP